MTSESVSELGKVLPQSAGAYALGPDDGEALWMNGGLGLLKATGEQTEGRYYNAQNEDQLSGVYQGRLKISKRGSGTVRYWLYLAALRLTKKRSPRRWALMRSSVPSGLTIVSQAASGRPVSAQGRNEQRKQYHSRRAGSAGAAGSRNAWREASMKRAGEV